MKRLLIPGLALLAIVASSCNGEKESGGTGPEADPILSVSPASLDFGAGTNSLPLNVANTGEGTLTWTATDDRTWISLQSASGTTTMETDQVTVTVDRAGLSAGSYEGAVTVTSDGGRDTVEVAMEVESAEPTYSGSFIISDTLVVGSTCSFPTSIGSTVNVTVEGDSITLATFGGTWDEAAKRGQGSGQQTIPIGIPPGCTVTYVFTFDITYTDYDNFHGTYHVDETPSTECGSGTCWYEYRIGGTRP